MAMLTGIVVSGLAGLYYMSSTTITSPILTVAIVTVACRVHLG